MAANTVFICVKCLTLILFLSRVLAENNSENEPKHRINIILLGATGDLAKRYLWKGFFNLYVSMKDKLATFGKYSTTIRFYGAAREDKETGNKTMMNIVDASIKCSDNKCNEMKAEFLHLCMYHRLKHTNDYENLQNLLQSQTCLDQKETEIGRIFYLSVPPFAYEEISRNIAANCRPKSPEAWVRVVLEKPFGNDLKSAMQLAEKLSKYWVEKEIYRIDHYLGKAGVMQIKEFKNQNQKFFEDMWNSNHIEQVKIVVKEHGDAQGRMGFYDHYGVIRDVFQNHLTEILVLVASEISEENLEKQLGNSKKSDLLETVQTVTIREAVFGQYKNYNTQLRKEVPNIKVDSITPTFSAVFIKIQNKRWFGVPFLLVSGKSLDARLAYVQITFKQQKFCIKDNLDIEPERCRPRDITFYIQGDKIGYPLTIFSRSFQGIKFTSSWENLTSNSQVSSQFRGSNMIMKPPCTGQDAYSSLISDVFLGNKDSFVSFDDLLLSWKIWNPLLEASDLVQPRLYSQDNLEDLEFGIVNGKISFISEPVRECQKSASGKNARMGVDDGQLHTFRGNKLVSGTHLDVVHQLANDITIAIYTKAQSGGAFHLALSGGSSPKQLFQVLSYMKHIPWTKVHIWIVDERCVSINDNKSNFGNIYELLIKHIPIPFPNIHPMPVDIAGKLCQPEDSAHKQYEKLLGYHLNNGSLDFVVLGVGNDGHTASLFPGSSLLRSLNWVELTDSRGSDERMTMTFPLLNQSKNIAVLILGDMKYDIMQKLIKGNVDPDNLPITAVKPNQGLLTWYIDDGALK